MVRRLLLLTYGVLSYALSLATFLYAVGFIGGLLTPTRLDGPRQGSLAAALAIDGGLLALFALQHSGMARPRFKRWLTRFVPGPAERSTYVLLSSAALLVLFWQWQPLGGVVWEVQGEAARAAVFAVYAAGWVTVLGTTFLINHFDLFGLRQVWLAFRGGPYMRKKLAMATAAASHRTVVRTSLVIVPTTSPQLVRGSVPSPPRLAADRRPRPRARGRPESGAGVSAPGAGKRRTPGGR